MDKEEIVRQLSEKVDAAWGAYVDELLQLSPSVLISRADEIAAASYCCDQLKSGGYPADYLEYLLRFNDPLAVMRDQWLEDRPDWDEAFEHALWSLWNYDLGPENDPDQDGMEMR